MPFPRLLGLTIALLGATSGVPPLAAQSGPSAGRTEAVRPSADSATVLAGAQRAQAAFERTRRANLPRRQGISGQYCDDVIGRYCFTDDGDTSEYALPEPPPPEAARVVAARLTLLAQLDSAGERLPGDEWIVGQQVRYRIEAGQLTKAEEHARGCAAARWWCDALLGLVHHAAWRYVDADAAFATALAAMPDSVRCAWTDLTTLFADSLGSEYKRASCAERNALNTRVWWLADPSHFRAGNDRRTEHYSRVVTDRLQRGATSGYGTAWRWDLGELLRRYGWPTHFTRTLPAVGRTDPPQISAYHTSPSYHFLPDAKPTEPSVLTEERWRLRPRVSHERYAPPYATFASLPQLTSLFRRADSTLVVAAYDARGDSLLPDNGLSAALIVSRSPDAIPVQVVREGASARGALTVMTHGPSMLASVEIIGGNRIDRARQIVAFADSSERRIRISDLAFFAAGDELPATLDAFLPVALASATVHRGDKLGLFWELYGLRADDDLTLRVQVVREGKSWLRRAGERVGLVGRPGPVAFGWKEDGRGGSIAARSVVVDLAGLDPGAYRIEVSLARAGDSPVIAARRLRIVP